jgi:hypothetical protein
MKKLLLFPCLFLLSLLGHTQTAPVKPNPYYKVTVSKLKVPCVLPYQAFATGRKGDTLLLLSGRTNGFHNFPAPPVASFPSNRSNDSFIVLIPSKNKVVKASVSSLLTTLATATNPNTVQTVTNNQLYQLASTNMQSCQNGDTLYCIGGYGYNGSMVTFGGCFAINVPRMIDLILKGGDSSTTKIRKAISFAANTDLPTSKITGGELLRTNNGYYLVVGQQFDGEYSNGAFSDTAPLNPTGYKQNYWSKIVPYFFNWANDTSFTASAGRAVQDFNALHRRDLNVVPVINSKGTKTIHIYGGVFTPTAFGGPYLNPVEITDSTGTLTYKQNNSTTQYFNQYASAHLSMFDAKSNTMFTTILGGISLYDSVASSANNQNVASGDTSMPWSNIISTMVKNNNTGSITEYASDDARLPGLIGGEAKFIAYKQYLLAGSDEIVDMAKVRAVSKLYANKVAVGIMFGGIVSQLPITATRSQTQTNPAIYTVYLSLK